MATPGGVFIRRSEFDDQPGIQALIGQEAEQVAKRFRHVDVTNMIENASLGITAVDEKGAVVGYAAFYDFPALTSEVDPVAWPEWLHGAFGHPEFTEANTAFLSFFLDRCASRCRYPADGVHQLPDVDALLFLLPRDDELFARCAAPDALQPLAASEEEEAAVRAYACPRAVLARPVIREARVEDHDDLVPVFNAQSEVLTERYGEFFIAELIEAQDEANRALVAEVDGHASACSRSRARLTSPSSSGASASARAPPPPPPPPPPPRQHARPRARRPTPRPADLRVRRADEAGRGGARGDARRAPRALRGRRRQAAQKAGSEDNPGKALLAAIFGAIGVDGSGRCRQPSEGRARGCRTRHDAVVEWLDADGDGQLTCDEFCYGTLGAHVMEGEDEAATAVVADLNEVLGDQREPPRPRRRARRRRRAAARPEAAAAREAAAGVGERQGARRRTSRQNLRTDRRQQVEVDLGVRPRPPAHTRPSSPSTGSMRRATARSRRRSSSRALSKTLG